MNKRQIKKKFKSSNLKISTINLKENDVLLVSVDRCINNNELKCMRKMFDDAFKHNKVIMIPNDYKFRKVIQNNNN